MDLKDQVNPSTPTSGASSPIPVRRRNGLVIAICAVVFLGLLAALVVSFNGGSKKAGAANPAAPPVTTNKSPAAPPPPQPKPAAPPAFTTLVLGSLPQLGPDPVNLDSQLTGWDQKYGPHGSILNLRVADAAPSIDDSPARVLGYYTQLTSPASQDYRIGLDQADAVVEYGPADLIYPRSSTYAPTVVGHHLWNTCAGLKAQRGLMFFDATVTSGQQAADSVNTGFQPGVEMAVPARFAPATSTHGSQWVFSTPANLLSKCSGESNYDE